MDKPDLDALDALLAKATPGPWACAGRVISDADGYNALAVTNLAMDDATANAHSYLIVAAVNALPQLLARVRELEQDAARYRWLRSADNSIDCMFSSTDCDGDAENTYAYFIDSLTEAALDAAIDAARKVQP